MTKYYQNVYYSLNYDILKIEVPWPDSENNSMEVKSISNSGS